MIKKSIEEINEKYDLEIEKIIDKIKKGNFKRVLLQFPDALKPYALTVCDEIESRAKCLCFIWMGSCFGGCDIPPEIEGIDLIVQFGHSKWNL